MSKRSGSWELITMGPSFSMIFCAILCAMLGAGEQRTFPIGSWPGDDSQELSVAKILRMFGTRYDFITFEGWLSKNPQGPSVAKQSQSDLRLEQIQLSVVKRLEHKKHAAEYNKRYYSKWKTNPLFRAKSIATARKWRKEHPLECKIARLKNKVKRRGAPADNTITKQSWEIKLREFNYAC